MLSDRYEMPKTHELLGAPPLDPTPLSDLPVLQISKIMLI